MAEEPPSKSFGEKRKREPQSVTRNKSDDLKLPYPRFFEITPTVLHIPHPTLPQYSLRGIVPFFTTLVTYCKQRWIGKSIGDTFVTEFPVRAKQNVYHLFLSLSLSLSLSLLFNIFNYHHVIYIF